MGGSAGSLDAIQLVLRGLPADLKAALVLATHMTPTAKSHLAAIFARATPLPVVEVQDGMELTEGAIYVARPNYHVLVERDHIHLNRGPKENHSRPALNPLFRSAALVYGPATVGVLLSGALDDGVAGLWEIKRRGGIVVVQDPSDALFPDMPSNAIQNVSVDYTEPASHLGSLLGRLIASQAKDMTSQHEKRRGIPTNITCPECRGPMQQFCEGELVEFSCRVKHTYSPESMLNAYSETEERELWAAVVALEEAVDLVERLKPSLLEDVYRAAKAEAVRKKELALILRAHLTRQPASVPEIVER